MTKETITARIIDYFKQNEDTFCDCIEQLDDYNGYLDYARYRHMYEMEDSFMDTPVVELLMLVYYGYDEEAGPFSEFCPNREYFRYSGGGNLVSADEKDYSDYLYPGMIQAMQDHKNYISAIAKDNELSELFSLLETVTA